MSINLWGYGVVVGGVGSLPVVPVDPGVPVVPVVPVGVVPGAELPVV